ncbi:MAG: peptidase M28, partial [Planctomycetota bacterium]
MDDMQNSPNNSRSLANLFTFGLLVIGGWVTGSVYAQSPDPKLDPAKEAELMSNVRQLTFEGRRAGEGYFNRDGSQMVFQSERYSGNPFFQIYVMDMETGDVEHISPGHGKTTCAWIHPDGNRVLFASTHSDPKAKDKQKKELEDRAAGKQKRYSWDYDEHYEIYAHNRATGSTAQLTNARGYCAEGSYSPDGKWIAFASNRQAYERDLTEEEKNLFELDKAFFNEIYIMRADGSSLKRLTNTPGYDGGPFFSPDGNRICWRRFNKDGSMAEIMTMNVDGSDQKQITRMNAMSWAPYYHPSGEYLIFTTNRHGFSNFELYLADVDAKTPPVRVTHTDGFDGLPVFTPDGKRIAWTTNRTANKRSQIFIGDWNHERALEMLRSGEALATQEADDPEAIEQATKSLAASSAQFRDQDLLRHVDYLCRRELEGRRTGTEGEKKATAYFAAYLDSLGIKPAGDNGSWYQPFEFTSGISLGEKNQLTWGTKSYDVDRQWRPLAFSENGDFEAAEVVFAGYGIKAPKDDDQEEYDSFVHLDVKDKWVLCFRFMPEGITPERRQ